MGTMTPLIRWNADMSQPRREAWAPGMPSSRRMTI